MSYFDFDRLERLDANQFQNQSPYPWANPQGCLRADGLNRLLEALTDVAMFETVFGKPRAHGQRSHDRYSLEYRAGLENRLRKVFIVVVENRILGLKRRLLDSLRGTRAGAG